MSHLEESDEGIESFDEEIERMRVLGYDTEKKESKTKKTKVQVIAKNLEKFTSIKIGNITMKDSLQFLPSSLDKLVSNLVKEDKTNSLENLKKTFPETYKFFIEKKKEIEEKFQITLSENSFRLLTRKGVYPYEYMDSFEKFHEGLPKKEEFYSKLTRKHITKRDYDHVKELWREFKMESLNDLHNLYMETDVMLLTDIFEKFREKELSTYGLDPAHFLTAPSLTWSAGLKFTGVTLELITDLDISMFIDQAMIGGISVITHPYANIEGNNGFIFYCDANNLYGWAMRQYLPTGEFKWLTSQEIKKWTMEKILSQKNEQCHGFFFEVDLDYPEELHDKHNNYPCAPEKITVEFSELSEQQQAYAKDSNIKPSEKLHLTLRNKKNYILHYRNLQQYLKLGLILKKIHKILQFDQSPWLKGYIDYNTDLRKKAQSAFEKAMLKLMNNAFYGKVNIKINDYI